MAPTSAPPPAGAAPRGSPDVPAASDYETYEGIDLREMFSRLARGLPQILGLAAIGLVVAAVVYLVLSPLTTATTAMRVTFAFNGVEKGEYPDHSKFQPDDLRAPDVVIDALKHLGLNADEEFQGQIRAAITVEGVIPLNVVKDRDRMRAAGQNPPTYVPDEYLVTLTLARDFPVSMAQRSRLLNEIVSVFRDRFHRTYAAPPLAFGNVQDTLRGTDYSDYEQVLNAEIQNIIAYLSQQVELARSFRSPTTNLSFGDLLLETQLFSQVQLNETLGLIRLYSLSHDRRADLVKMDYTLKTLADQERLALEEEKTDREYLAKAEEHSRNENYLVGVKSEAAQARTEAPLLDQGLVNSLLANDAYNLVIRKALDASLRVKRIEAEQARILERRKEMEAAMREDTSDQSALMKRADASLKILGAAYDQLIAHIRSTYADYARQQFGNAVRISMQPVTGSKYKPVVLAGGVGAFLGLALGMGLSLLGVYIGAAKRG